METYRLVIQFNILNGLHLAYHPCYYLILRQQTFNWRIYGIISCLARFFVVAKQFQINVIYCNSPYVNQSFFIYFQIIFVVSFT